MKSIIFIISLILSISTFSAIKSIKLDSESLIDVEGFVLPICRYDQSTYSEIFGMEHYTRKIGAHIVRITMSDGSIFRYKTLAVYKSCKDAKIKAKSIAQEDINLLKTIKDNTMTYEKSSCFKTIGYLNINDETNVATRIQTIKLQVDCP
jgi:hypothetical protein